MTTAEIERLVDAAESLRCEVAKFVNDPDQKERPGLEEAYCRTIKALDAVRSLPPDTQDAALTAEREALLRRAVESIALLKTWLGTEHSRDAINTADAVLADAERLGITGDAK